MDRLGVADGMDRLGVADGMDRLGVADGMDRLGVANGMDRRHGPAGRFVGTAATSHPDGPDSRPDAGLADAYLASPARSRIRLRQGVRRPLGYTRQNARRPVLVLRESAASAPRSGTFDGAVGLRTRNARLRTGGATAIPPADTPPHSSPSTPRRPRLSRVRSGDGLPFGLWRRLSEGDGQVLRKAVGCRWEEGEVH